MLDSGLRTCKTCKETLPLLISFYGRKEGGYRHTCKECICKSKRRNAPTGRPRTISDSTQLEIVEMYRNGESPREIADSLKITTRIVYGALIRTGLMKSSPRFRPKLNHDFFESITTEEQAYWLGFLAADGNVYGDKTLTVNLAAIDKGHLTKMIKALQGDCRVREYVATNQSGKSYAACSLTITSPKLVSDLKRLGIVPQKSTTLKPWIGPSHLMRHYWRGLVDGDGCIYVNASERDFAIQLVGTAEVVAGFSEFIKDSMIQTNASCRKERNRNLHSIYFAGRILVDRIGNLLYKDAQVYLDRKYEKLKIILSETSCLNKSNLYRQTLA